MIHDVLSVADDRYGISRQVVHEWEEECAKYFGIPIRQVSEKKSPEFRVIGKKSKSLLFLKGAVKGIFHAIPAVRRLLWDSSHPALTQDISRPLSVCFAMDHFELSVCVGSNCIPVLLDVWSDWDIREVVRRTKDLRLFYVTSRDVYNRVKAASPQSNVHYMPLSIADKYHSPNFAAYRNKTIDVLHSSRRNRVLHEYMLRYCGEYPSIDYVYRDEGGYVSVRGRKIGSLPERKDYMNLLASAKVYLVGCSGVDESRDDTYGICFTTPRFYEGAVSGCAMLSRYPDNQEFRELNMSRYCPNITSYDQFTHELERVLSQTPEELYAQNRDFILNSLTSKRAEQIRHDLEELTCGQNS